MNFHKFYVDSQLNAAIFSLFSVPIEELSDKLAEKMSYFRENHPFDFEIEGKAAAIKYFRAELRDEVMKWMENNEEINKFLVDSER